MPDFIIPVSDIILGKTEQETKDNDVMCSLIQATVKNDHSEYYFKKLPEKNQNINSFRSIHEALCGYITKNINDETQSSVVTPDYHLVVDDNKVVGLLVRKVDYKYSDVFNKDGYLHAFFADNTNIGNITALRFFLEDPDCSGNISFQNNKISSIDYGLALFSLLLDKKKLLDREVERVGEEEFKVFDLNPENILTFFLNSGKGIEPIFLVTHFFPNYRKILDETMAKKPEVAKKFFQEIFTTLHIIAKMFDKEGFKEDLKAKLQFAKLCETDQVDFNLTLDKLIARAKELKSTFDALVKLDIKAFMQMLPKGLANPELIYEAFVDAMGLSKSNNLSAPVPANPAPEKESNPPSLVPTSPATNKENYPPSPVQSSHAPAKTDFFNPKPKSQSGKSLSLLNRRVETEAPSPSILSRNSIG